KTVGRDGLPAPRGHRAGPAGPPSTTLAKRRRDKPYLAVGAGVISRSDGSPEAILVGDYRFGLVFPPGFPPPAPLPTFHETDTVVVRSSSDTAPAGVFGCGLEVGVKLRLGVRIRDRDRIV